MPSPRQVRPVSRSLTGHRWIPPSHSRSWEARGPHTSIWSRTYRRAATRSSATTSGSVETPRSWPEFTSVTGRLSRPDRWLPKTCRTTPSSAGTPQHTLVGGNPATHIRYRFTQDEVRSLVRLAWWGWPIEVITENIRTIAAGPVKDLEQIALRLPR